MEPVTKVGPRQRCLWCRKAFKPKAGGRPALYCGASCRQRAYEKRKWVPYSASDALSRDLLPAAAVLKLRQEERRGYMLELVMTGTVPLVDVAQIDGILDHAKPPERQSLLRRIEDECRRRGDGLSTITRWRLSRQEA